MAYLRYNEQLCYWEFGVPDATGKPQAQFWMYFEAEASPITGLKPARPLDDDEFRIAMDGLEKTFVGNREPKKLLKGRMDENFARHQEKIRVAAHDFADYVHDHRSKIFNITSIGWTSAIEGTAVRHRERRSAHTKE